MLKAKAGTTYVNNEWAKKVNHSSLNNYALKSDLNDPVYFYCQDLSHNNTQTFTINPLLLKSTMSHSNHFSIFNNELVFKISGFYQFTFTDSIKSTNGVNFSLLATNIERHVRKALSK